MQRRPVRCRHATTPSQTTLAEYRTPTTRPRRWSRWRCAVVAPTTSPASWPTSSTTTTTRTTTERARRRRGRRAAQLPSASAARHPCGPRRPADSTVVRQPGRAPPTPATASRRADRAAHAGHRDRCWAAVFGWYAWAQQQYYVRQPSPTPALSLPSTADRPRNCSDLQLSNVVETSDIACRDLPEFEQEQVPRHIPARSLDGAAGHRGAAGRRSRALQPEEPAVRLPGAAMSASTGVSVSTDHHHPSRPTQRRDASCCCCCSPTRFARGVRPS